jgi:hypothetical protein
MRLQRDSLPNYPISCPRLTCPYNTHGQCDIGPCVNKGNSDAICHDWSNKDVLEMLGVAAYAKDLP